MKLISQHTKKIMEECKEKAREAGLRFSDETLEYIVTNSDLLELSPKNMIPTMYDYWVHDVGVIQGKGIYKIYPNNPYETVINTRPAISFYNDNNPDWINVFIFYHVIGHIDCFQNNVFFEKTWDYDFCGRALSDKRLITKMREKMGAEKRWVDYAIEFARSIDNLANYHSDLNRNTNHKRQFSKRIDFYFDIFLQEIAKVSQKEYFEEIDRYNGLPEGKNKEAKFFELVKIKHVDFNERFESWKKEKKEKPQDLMQHIMEYSEFLNKKENKWIKSIIGIMRDTSLFFSPQIRTKIINEGWASYWHEKLFLQDKRICGHEVGFAKIDSGVTMMPRAGLNPYGLGKRLLIFAEDLADRGKLSYDFQKIKDSEERKRYDKKTGRGQEFIFELRKYFNDFRLFNFLSKDDFQNFVNKNKLFVAGKKLDPYKGVWKYYIKSRNGEDYRKMVTNSLYHPPHITFSSGNSNNGALYLNHHFEGKELVQKYIPDVMRGLAYLWGRPVKLETTVFDINQNEAIRMYMDPDYKPRYRKIRIVYELDNYKEDLKLKRP